ncbi:MAG: S-layer homology domain-containing protein [Bacillota bacterium]
MFNRLFKGIVSVALAAGLVIGSQTAPANAATSFKDTASHWSKQVVEKSNALGLMKGYPGGIFKPESPVSRLEAIAIIIRAMNLEEEALKLDYKNSEIKLPSGMTWGQGHLVLAARKGLLHKDYVSQLRYNDPITRQEVATLVAVALRDKLKVDGDVKKLTFSDNDEIDLTYQPYVADVTQNNIMLGIGGNKFGPKQIMKRGQMAALVSKTAQDGWFSFGTDNIINGTLTMIDKPTGLVTITTPDGDKVSKLVNSSTALFIDSKEGDISGFSKGDKVTAITGADARILYMETAAGEQNTNTNTNTGTETSLTGKITDISSYTNPTVTIISPGFREQSLAMDPSATITAGSQDTGILSLKAGVYVKVTIKNNVIENVKILPTETTGGTVNSVMNDYFIINTGAGSRIFSVPDGKLNIYDGTGHLSYSDLKAGDGVKVVSVSGTGEALEASLVKIEEQSYEKVQVRAVDSFYRIITILDNNNNRKDFDVALQALIERGNERVTLDDIKQGDIVTLKIGGDGEVTEIMAYGKATRNVSGTVTEIKTGSSPRIYVDSDRYDLAGNVDITRNGENIDLTDIMIGAKVTLKVDDNDIATSVEVTDDEDITVEGTVTDVDTRNDKITIEQQDGDLEFTLKVDSDYTIRDTISSNAAEELGDIKDGWVVMLYLENGRVTQIRVLDK